MVHKYDSYEAVVTYSQGLEGVFRGSLKLPTVALHPPRTPTGPWFHMGNPASSQWSCPTSMLHVRLQSTAIPDRWTVTAPPHVHLPSSQFYQVLSSLLSLRSVNPPLPSAPLTLSFRQHCPDEQWSHCYLKVAYCEGCSQGAAEVTLTV